MARFTARPSPLVRHLDWFTDLLADALLARAVAGPPGHSHAGADDSCDRQVAQRERLVPVTVNGTATAVITREPLPGRFQLLSRRNILAALREGVGRAEQRALTVGAVQVWEPVGGLIRAAADVKNHVATDFPLVGPVDAYITASAHRLTPAAEPSFELVPFADGATRRFVFTPALGPLFQVPGPVFTALVQAAVRCPSEDWHRAGHTDADGPRAQCGGCEPPDQEDLSEDPRLRHLLWMDVMTSAEVRTLLRGITLWRAVPDLDLVRAAVPSGVSVLELAHGWDRLHREYAADPDAQARALADWKGQLATLADLTAQMRPPRDPRWL